MSNWPGTENYIYISHLDAGEDPDGPPQYWKLPCTPDSITDSMGSQFNTSTALGRSAPVYTYSNSGPRTVQVSLTLRRDMMDEANSTASVNNNYEDTIDGLIRALQSIAVPKYTLSDKSIEPPLVALRLSNEVFIKGVVTDSIGLTYELPILSTVAGDRYAQVKMSLLISEVDPYDASSVYKNGSFRGVVSSVAKGLHLSE